MFNSIVTGFLLMIFTCSLTYAEDFGAWSYLTDKNGSSISQIISTDPQAQKVVMGISVNFLHSDDRPTLNIRISSNALKSAGIGFKVDKNKPMRFPISKCDDQVCTAVVWLDEQLLKEMKKGKMATAAYALQNKKQITLPVNLMGFTKAYSKLTNKDSDKI